MLDVEAKSPIQNLTGNWVWPQENRLKPLAIC